MNERRLRKELHSKLQERGYKSRTVSIKHLRDLQEGIEGDLTRGLLNEEFYQERLTHFSFKPPDIMPDAESLIVVAIPQPQTRVVFACRGESRPVIIPPTYLHQVDKTVEDTLSSILNAAERHVARATLPLKLLAARSGLGEYGRNNICYVPGMGSLHRLVAFYMDLPCSEESWGEPQVMERCRSCRACLRSCPTEAITADRFLIRAERCITFHNERLTEFPTWIDSSWHNCLVGCLRCQKVCPENTPFLDRVECNEIFSQEETDLILDSTPPARLPSETVKKLERLDMLEYSDILGRNLSVLLREGESCSQMSDQTSSFGQDQKP